MTKTLKAMEAVLDYMTPALDARLPFPEKQGWEVLQQSTFITLTSD